MYITSSISSFLSGLNKINLSVY